MEQIKELFKNKMLLVGLLIVAGLAFYFFVYQKKETPPQQYYPQKGGPYQQGGPYGPPPPELAQYGMPIPDYGGQPNYQTSVSQQKGYPPQQQQPQQQQEEDYALPGEDDLRTEVSEEENQ